MLYKVNFPKFKTFICSIFPSLENNFNENSTFDNKFSNKSYYQTENYEQNESYNNTEYIDSNNDSFENTSNEVYEVNDTYENCSNNDAHNMWAQRWYIPLDQISLLGCSGTSLMVNNFKAKINLISKKKEKNSDYL